MTGDSAVIRPAAAADNPALLGLMRRCSMAADISLIIERDPDFFALSRARGDGETLVAESGGVVAGCVSSWRRRVWLAGRPGMVGFVGDLRIDPAHRRRGIGGQLGRAIIERVDTLSPAPYLVATGVGNAAVDRLVATLAARPLTTIARFTSCALLSVGRLRIPSGLDIGPGEGRDQAELVALLDDFHRQRLYAPVFADGGLEAVLECSPGMKLSDYWLARRQGRTVAAVGVWDAAAIKQTRVTGMPRWLRSLCAVGRVVSRVTPMPLLPGPGTLLRLRYLRHPACRPGELEALRALVRCAVKAARARGEGFGVYSCEDGDPIAAAVAGLPRLRFHYALAAAYNRPGAANRQAMSGDGYWHFDDAALA